MKHVFLFIILISFSVSSYSQNFSRFRDTISYPGDLKYLLGSAPHESDIKAVADLKTKWEQNVFSQAEKGLIIDISQNWHNRKAIGVQFISMVNFILACKRNVQTQTYLIPTLTFFKKYINEKRTTLNAANNLLRTLTVLINENYLFVSNATKWKYTGHPFEISADTAKLYFNFAKGMLTCYSKRDSIRIFETSGIFYPLENTWVGKGGMVTWEKSGYEPKDVRAMLDNYTLELNKNDFSADSVTLYYPKYFSSPILGKLNDRVMQVTNKETTSYPEFDSYSKRFFLENIYPNVDYDGGITLKGARVIGSGNIFDDAKIIIKDDKKPLMEVRSKYFVFRPERVNGLNSTVKIFLETDSIYHSDLNFIYYVDKMEVNLQKSESYSSRSPYYNSYHRIDMDIDQLTWRINQPKISFGMARGATIGRARFVSQSFYNQAEFDKIQGRSDEHPLVQLRKYAIKNYNDEFTASAFADYVGRPLDQVRQLLMSIAEQGFIYYNNGDDYVKLKKRLYDYLQAAGGKVDFDVIDFLSLVQAPMDNAVLDMETLDLVINGMPKVMVSDSQSVAIFPKNEQIILKRNRSFQFDGRIEAGLLTFKGSNFFFSYDTFKINLQNVDEAEIKVFTGERDNFGKPVTRELKNSIKHITGDLLVDKPDNKSGRKNYDDYPLFRSRQNSYVYYQYPDIEGGVYPEESFYFEVAPFVLDSLDNFSKAGLVFKGKFFSSDILPVIEQKLAVQYDYSLGFKYSPGPEGIPVYKNKGKLFGKIDLNTKGLRADGKLTYLTSTTLSNDFKFYPDSMNTQSKEFNMTKSVAGTQFPKVDSKENYIHWNTRFNEMYISQGKEPFKMFNPETTLAGSLLLEPKGLSGKGKMDLTTANLSSEKYTYKADIIDADTAAFDLKSLHTSGLTVQTKNVKSHIDFSTRKGDFTSNEDFSLVNFPENQYISYLDYFKWNMSDKTLEMGAKRTPSKTKTPDKASDKTLATPSVYDRFSFKEEPIGPRYISVNPKQDSLNFVAPLAVYDYEKNLLNASNVKLIRVADAIIYPKDGKVTIKENSQMRTLFNTKIVAGFENRFHTIHTADVDISSRFNFTGKGKYDYIDENKMKQVVDLQEIKVDTAKHTFAIGNIIEQDTFTLNPHFAFQGKLLLYSTRELLTFDGGATIITKCSKPGFHWLKFKSEIDPLNILIPVTEPPVNINNDNIFNGIFMAYDSIHVYPAFLSKRRNYNDKYIVSATGYLRYNKDSMLYEIASFDKLQNRSLSGNYINYHKYKCAEYGEGKLDLGLNLGQVKLNTYGTALFNTVNNDVKFDLLMGVNFMIDQNILKYMANKIDSFPDLKGLDITRPLYVNMQNEKMGRTNAEKYREEMALMGKPKVMPVEMDHTINFTYLKLRWNHETRSYQSVGKIGIGNIASTQINKMVDGFIEITRRRSGDYMDIYLKLDANNYYYFGYTRGVMQVYSTDAYFVNSIRALSLKQRQMSVKRGETTYIYMVSSDSRQQNFIRNYQRYQKGEETQEMPDDIPENELPKEEDLQQESPDQPVVEPQIEEKSNAPEEEVIEVQ